MALRVDLSSVGSDFNYLGLALFGDPVKHHAPEFSVDWGDGTTVTVQADFDTDGDGIKDEGITDHTFAADGVYDIQVDILHSKAPSAYIDAFCYSDDTAGVKLTGSDLDDLALGGHGNDQITLGDGHNWGFGRDGNDLIVGGSGSDQIAGGAGNDKLYGGAGDDSLDAGEGRDILIGGAGSDQLFDYGSDHLSDTMKGGAGNDFLGGGQGDDFLDGGTGKDYLVGSGGNDLFVFDANASHRTLDRGSVQDFAQGSDHFEIMALSGKPLSFIGTKLFGQQGAEVRFEDSDSGATVYVDLDGNGKADYSFVLPTPIGLTVDDFVFPSGRSTSSYEYNGGSDANPASHLITLLSAGNLAVEQNHAFA